MRGHHVGELGDQLRTVAEADLRLEPILHRRQAQPLEPGHRGVERRAVLQIDILHGRTTPRGEGLAQQSHPLWILRIASLTDEAFEPYGVDCVGLHHQPVAAVLPLDHPVRQRLP